MGPGIKLSTLIYSTYTYGAPTVCQELSRHLAISAKKTKIHALMEFILAKETNNKHNE